MKPEEYKKRFERCDKWLLKHAKCSGKKECELKMKKYLKCIKKLQHDLLLNK